ncbi:MAG: sugar phosphate isomerase/epimerase family protein [bacterium]
MTNEINRRAFVKIATLAGMGAVAQTAAPAANPEEKSKRMKVGLYSITYLGLWYRGRELSLEDVIRRAKQYGYEGVEIDGKRPHGNPLDWPARRCQELRKFAEGEGVPIYGAAANNDFSSPIPEHREAQIAYVRDLIRMASDLGAKAVRVFLAWPGVTRHPQTGRYDIARNIWKATHEPFSEEETWAWCREGLSEAARYACDYGVTLALQNHAPVIKDHQDVLRMVREIDSPYLKVSLDPSIMPDKSPAAVRQAALDVGPLQALSHFGGDFQRGSDGTIQGTSPFELDFVRAMAEIGYTGYIGYELCHPLPVVNGQTVGIEYADECARSACEYMRGLIRQTYKGA